MPIWEIIQSLTLIIWGPGYRKPGAAPLVLIILNMLISRIFRRITARGSLGMMR
ncbi:hypothetical protein SPAB_03314 [Salmonella enterica subsp. enterica serovar Paratyphi B str. SPB7]|uniref:Uncharacterized protein n=1 Tax=Salmonella paratyphi B (strain ATCC BAA-1250 / SPB7) TaxID=1016998 RepID=A0A6C6Z4L9_SALPB|nr:hypothetical protein SPAB_03314 [Salmonella enterica subsp. enterica serovar Paratyphi B str. SPB7]